MKILHLILVCLLISVSGCSQTSSKTKNVNTAQANDKKVGGRCEGCAAVYESPVPFEELNETDTLPDFNDNGPKIEISGTVYKPDGKAPAPGVILYVYHTDQTGVYPKKGNETGWAKQHGYLRGWVKTDSKGSYKFFTLVPASYPNSTNPKHLHPTIKEPGYSEYWIDEYLFADDPLLPKGESSGRKPVGGSGVLRTEMIDGILRAKRDIVLGLNVEGYK